MCEKTPPAAQGRRLVSINMNHTAANDCWHRERRVLRKCQIRNGAKIDRKSLIKQSHGCPRRQPPGNIAVANDCRHGVFSKSQTNKQCRVRSKIINKVVAKTCERCKTCERDPLAARGRRPAGISMINTSVSDCWHQERCVLCKRQVPNGARID